MLAFQSGLMSSAVSIHLKFKRFALQVIRKLRSVFRPTSTIYVNSRVQEYRSYWSGAAEKIGATFEDIYDGVWSIGLNGRTTRIANYVTEADSPVTLILACNKSYCADLANKLKIPTAVTGRFDFEDIRAIQDAVSDEDGLGVIKPDSGSSSGLGITTQIRSISEIKKAVLLASLYDKSILLERFVPSESCRLLYLNFKLIHSLRGTGVRLVGDGVSSILELSKRAYPETRTDDPIVQFSLQSQGLTTSSVLPNDVSVVIRHVSEAKDQTTEFRTVYDEDVTPPVGFALNQQITELVSNLQCNLVGVDILTNDLSCRLEDSGGVFLELNTTPGIHHHYLNSTLVQEASVAEPILKYLLSR